MDSPGRWQSFPKVELHTHLDCSIGYEAARRLTSTLTIEEFERDFVAPTRCMDLAEFLSRVSPSVELMQTKTALRLCVESLFQQLAADGVIYAELRFAPLLHLDSLEPETVVETVLSAMKAQESIHGIKAGLILCTLRHFGERQSATTARLVERYLSEGVVALDIAGDEAAYSLEPHIAAFRALDDCGARTTAHAGEACGPESVWETISSLKPNRVGHGVRSIGDERLVDHLVAEGIHLEICPAVNLQIQLYPSLAEHPVDRLLRRGVSMGINTDGRTVVGTSLTEDYRRLEQAFGWDRQTFARVNQSAATASFASDADKEWIRHRLAAASSEEPKAGNSGDDPDR